MCCFMHARAEVSVLPSPGRPPWVQRVMCTETESFNAVPVFRCSGPRTYKHTVSHLIRQGICIQQKPQLCGKLMQQAGFVWY